MIIVGISEQITHRLVRLAGLVHALLIRRSAGQILVHAHRVELEVDLSNRQFIRDGIHVHLVHSIQLERDKCLRHKIDLDIFTTQVVRVVAVARHVNFGGDVLLARVGRSIVTKAVEHVLIARKSTVDYAISCPITVPFGKTRRGEEHRPIEVRIGMKAQYIKVGPTPVGMLRCHGTRAGLIGVAEHRM